MIQTGSDLKARSKIEHFGLSDEATSALIPYPLAINIHSPIHTALALRMEALNQTCDRSPSPAPAASRKTPWHAYQERSQYVFVCDQDRLVGYLSEREIFQWMVASNTEPQLTASAFMQFVTCAVSEHLSLSVPSTLQHLLDLCQSRDLDLLPVLGPQQALSGFITQANLQRQLQIKQSLLPHRADRALVTNGTCVAANTPLSTLAKYFSEYAVDYLVLLEPQGQVLHPLGILDRPHFLEIVSAGTRLTQPLPPERLTTRPPILRPDASLWTAYQYLQNTATDTVVIIDATNTFQGILTLPSVLQVLKSQLDEPFRQPFTQLAPTPFNDFEIRAQLPQAQFLAEPLNQATAHALTQDPDSSYLCQQERLDSYLQQTISKEREFKDLKTQFITNASHEFRTPLAVIASSAGILRDFGDKLDQEKKLAHFQRIQTSVQKTTQLLDNFLLIDPVSSEQRNCTVQALDLLEWIQVLIAELKVGHPHRAILLETNPTSDHTAVAFVDEKLLRQILSNVLSNAIKYSAPDSSITLQLELGCDRILFDITDHGLGIPKTAIPHVFQPFFRADNVEHIAGTGLGLAIAQNCTERHGGYLHLHSELSKGTRVRLILPNQC